MATPVLPNNPLNYISPSRLSVWFAPLKDDGTYCAPTDLGSVRDIALTMTDEKLEHDTARNGLLTDDFQVVTKVTAEIKFVLEELVGENLIYLFRPDEAPNAAAEYEVCEQVRCRLNGTTAVAIDTLQAVDANNTDYLELYWLDDTVDDVLVRTLDGATTYTEGAGNDYLFVQAIASTSPATIARDPASSIADGEEVVISYQFKRQTTSYKVQTGANLYGKLKVQALNKVGPQFAYEFPYVSLGIDGDMTVNPSEWLTQGFMVKVLTDGKGVRGTFHLFDNYLRNNALNCT